METLKMNPDGTPEYLEDDPKKTKHNFEEELPDKPDNWGKFNEQKENEQEEDNELTDYLEDDYDETEMDVRPSDWISEVDFTSPDFTEDTKYMTQEEKKEWLENLKREEAERLEEKIEREKEEAYSKSLPDKKPTPDDDVEARKDWFTKTKEVLGEFDPETSEEYFLETGFVLGKLPASVYRLTSEQAKHLREVNTKSYNNLVKAGMKIEDKIRGGIFRGIEDVK